MIRPRLSVSAETSTASLDPEAMPALRFGGEFLERSLEKAFGQSRLVDALRHSRWLLIASAVLNTLFLLSDWRFAGTPQFWVAVPARLTIVLVSLACAWALGRCTTSLGLQRVMGRWIGVTAIAVAALVSSHSDLALFVLLLLPMIFYLGVPLPFAWTVGCGVGASALLLGGYELHAVAGRSVVGLMLALATLNTCLMLVVARANRAARMEWHTTRTARAIAEELAANREMLERLFAAAPVPMVVTCYDDGRILQVNDSCANMFGITADMIGTESFQRFYADPEERTRLMALLERDGQVEDFEAQAICAAGRRRTVMVKATAVDMAIGRTVMAGIIDISDRKAVELSLEWLASTDPLTKLPNRLSFFSTARAEMMRAARSGQPLALLMIDLDHFKVLNDTYGHQAGDRALKAFGGLCREHMRPIDIAGRLGGEEFGILLPDTDAAAAVRIGERLCEALRTLRLPPNEGLRLTASIGAANIHRDDRDLDAALARADGALYMAKRSGRDKVCYAMIESPPARTVAR